jgi:GT2 family glycosyltransferase
MKGFQMYTIIIPTYGTRGISMTNDLLDSMSKFNNPSLGNIIISDDGSNADTIPRLTSLVDKYKHTFSIIPIYNQPYHSFSKTVNRGLEISNGNNDILLLNNDMLALTSFEPFIDFIKEKQNTNQNKIGIVGAKLLYPNNTIQHAGMARMRLIKRFRHIYKYRNHNHPPTMIAKKYIAVTGACHYIRRDLIDKIGYYDEDYILSYEDVDYCLNAQSNGYETWYIPDVVMTHLESSTRTDPYSEQNRALLWKKWGSSYEAIRTSQNIPDDDLDIKVVEASGLAGLYVLFRKF